jgi:hypothetical protein
VKDEGLQENLGIAVQIVGHSGYKTWYPFSMRLKRPYKRPKRLYTWIVVALSSRGICYGSHYDRTLYFCREGEFPDAYLQRLPKLPADNEVFAEKGIKSGVLCEAKRCDYETQE